MELNQHLPKWPAFVVSGKKVLEDQAKEIIIRTSSLDFISNDKEFESQINEILYGIPLSYFDLNDELTKRNNGDYSKVCEEKEALLEKYKVLPLNYLYNSRILSSWIGGPHGWCRWDGNIFCNNYNIGKYPSCEEIYKEWEIIAEAFPYLELRSQLFDKEAGEANITPVIEFIVEKGKVTYITPKEPLCPTIFGSDNMFNRLSNPYRERGCTINQFKEALKCVEKSLQPKTQDTQLER